MEAAWPACIVELTIKRCWVQFKLLDLFHGGLKYKSSAMLVKSQLVCLQPAGILSNIVQVELFVSYLLGPTILFAIYIAKDK